MPISVIAFYNSRTDIVPRWYVFFNILGGVAAMFGIYLISNELVSSLETLGITLNRSHTFIGCTLYTWGTGLSDMLANVAIARRGYPRMAFSACLGSTILSKLSFCKDEYIMLSISIHFLGIFTSICVPIFYRTIKLGEIEVCYELFHYLSFLLSQFSLPAQRGYRRRNYLNSPHYITHYARVLRHHNQLHVTSYRRFDRYLSLYTLPHLCRLQRIRIDSCIWYRAQLGPRALQ